MNPVFTFTDSVPSTLESAPLLMVSEASNKKALVKFLLVELDKGVRAFEMRFDYHVAPFQEAYMDDVLLAVGIEDRFFLYNHQTQQCLLDLQMNGYFGHLNRNEDCFYVADAAGLICIHHRGEILWQNHELAVDGVIIERIDNQFIFGRGEQDPPGGWTDFILDRRHGFRIVT